LLDRAWPGVIVEDNPIAVQISNLRKVLASRAPPSGAPIAALRSWCSVRRQAAKDAVSCFA
jgi:hypothetical protein